MLYLIVYSNIIIGLLIIALGIPLILEKIKPNSFYGFRTKKTLSDKNIWYPANKYSGKLMVSAGVIITVLSVLFIIIYPYLKITFALFIAINLFIIFIPIALMLIMSLLYLKKL